MLRIALAQINTIVGNLEGNYYKLAYHIYKARSIAADVVVFPEMAITGYPPEDLLHKKHFIKDNIHFLKKLSKDTANITAVAGFVDMDKQGRLYNAAAVLHNKQIKGIYHKKELPNYSVFDEKRYFEEGEKNSVFIIKKAAIGVSVCEDIWVPKGPCAEQSGAGANVLINISCSPFFAGKSKQREKFLRDRARKHKSYICYANLVGGQDELVFDGASMIIDPKGDVVASAKQFEEDFVVADLKVTRKPKTFATANVKVAALSKLSSPDSRLTIQGKVQKRLPKSEEVLQALILGTRDYVLKNGFKKVVVGISGGIDSAVVAAVAVQALGRDNVIGMTMPSKYSSAGTRSDAKQLAENLGIKLIEKPIQGVFANYLKQFKKEFAGTKSGVAEENLQARIRGDVLMTYSNKFGWLVLTTGNKSEVAVGYCTLYGDMSGGFAVIKDVHKTQVYEIAKVINKLFGGVIPGSIIKRAPTAELKANQRDQDSLPPYTVLDPILKKYVEEHRSLEQIARKNGMVKVAKKVIALVDSSEYKRRQAPPGIKITPRAFGKDWRLPITNKYKGF